MKNDPSSQRDVTVVIGGDVTESTIYAAGRDIIVPGAGALATLARPDLRHYLRVLVIIAAPVTGERETDRPPVPLDARAEWQNLARAVRESHAPIALIRLTPPTPDALRHALGPRAREQGYAPQVVHFIGHGERQGLWFEDEWGRARLWRRDKLVAAFRDSGVRLAVLNACHSATADGLSVAEALVREVERRRVPFGIAHTYLGHWSSWFSRWVVRSGKLGAVRWADASYLQGWVARRAAAGADFSKVWRTRPAVAGPSCCGGDIGTHAFMQLRFVTGLEVVALRAMLEAFCITSGLDDHFTTYCELSNGGRALVRASQIAIGHKNDLRLEVVCEEGTLAWRQEEAEKVTIHTLDGSEHTYWRGALPERDRLLGAIPKWLRVEATIPAGHPEGFHDAYARLHRSFEADVRRYNAGRPFRCDGSRYANVRDGLAHMRFVEAAVASSRRGGKRVVL